MLAKPIFSDLVKACSWQNFNLAKWTLRKQKMSNVDTKMLPKFNPLSRISQKWLVFCDRPQTNLVEFEHSFE